MYSEFALTSRLRRVVRQFKFLHVIFPVSLDSANSLDTYPTLNDLSHSPVQP